MRMSLTLAAAPPRAAALARRASNRLELRRLIAIILLCVRTCSCDSEHRRSAALTLSLWRNKSPCYSVRACVCTAYAVPLAWTGAL